MGFIPALNTVRIAIEFSLSGQICVNVVYAKKSTTVLSTDLTALITAIRGWWTTDAKGSFHSDLTIRAIRTRDMTTQAGLVEDYIYAIPEAGTVGGVCAPNNVAVACSYRTGLAGRSYRGRSYWMGIPEAAYTDNYLDTGYPTVFATIGADLGDAIESVTDFTHVVASFYANKSARGQAVLTTITQYVVDARIDTQRRRLPPN